MQESKSFQELLIPRNRGPIWTEHPYRLAQLHAPSMIFTPLQTVSSLQVTEFRVSLLLFLPTNFVQLSLLLQKGRHV